MSTKPRYKRGQHNSLSSRNIVVGSFCALFGFYTVMSFSIQIDQMIHHDSEITLASMLFALLPAIPTLAGVLYLRAKNQRNPGGRIGEWCRRVVRGCSLFLLPLWPFLPLAQHAIDRTPGFWVFWSFAGLLFVMVVIQCAPSKETSS